MFCCFTSGFHAEYNKMGTVLIILVLCRLTWEKRGLLWVNVLPEFMNVCESEQKGRAFWVQA